MLSQQLNKARKVMSFSYADFGGLAQLSRPSPLRLGAGPSFRLILSNWGCPAFLAPFATEPALSWSKGNLISYNPESLPDAERCSQSQIPRPIPAKNAGTRTGQPQE